MIAYNGRFETGFEFVASTSSSQSLMRRRELCETLSESEKYIPEQVSLASYLKKLYTHYLIFGRFILSMIKKTGEDVVPSFQTIKTNNMFLTYKINIFKENF